MPAPPTGAPTVSRPVRRASAGCGSAGGPPGMRTSPASLQLALLVQRAGAASRQYQLAAPRIPCRTRHAAGRQCDACRGRNLRHGDVVAAPYGYRLPPTLLSIRATARGTAKNVARAIEGRAPQPALRPGQPDVMGPDLAGYGMFVRDRRLVMSGRLPLLVRSFRRTLPAGQEGAGGASAPQPQRKITSGVVGIATSRPELRPLSIWRSAETSGWSPSRPTGVESVT